MNSSNSAQQCELLPKSKIYFSISEVCKLTSLEAHVLRYWESEFPQLRPKKNRSGNRAYKTKDIETINFIKQLLYEEKFTIPGAKKRLAERKSPDTATEKNLGDNIPAPVTPCQNESIKKELEKILCDLKS